MFGIRRKETKGRQTPRVSVDFYLNKIIGDEPYLTRARDISVNGIYLYKILEPEIPVLPDSIGLEFQLPGSEHTIWALGEVVRDESNGSSIPSQGKRGMALRFTRLKPKDKKRIAAFVKAKEASEMREQL